MERTYDFQKVKMIQSFVREMQMVWNTWCTLRTNKFDKFNIFANPKS